MQRLTNSMVAVVRAKILATQQGLCAVCRIAIAKEGKTPTLDHDHDSGVCRGVLCNNCNGLEGKINNIANRAKRDGSPLEWLESLVAYLNYHKVNRTAMLHPTHKTLEEKRVLKNKRARVKRAADAKAKVLAARKANEAK